jgi:hypothetical protein
MSRENVELVRRYLERVGDLAPEGSQQLASDFWDPDGDYYPAQKLPEARPCHGQEDIARYLADYALAWDRFELAIRKVIAVGDDRVLDHVIVRAEGRGSGMQMNGDLYHCMWLRRGRLLRQEDHLTLRGAIQGFGLDGEALEAAGLRE